MDGIKLIGCRENNLKDIDILIPYSKITTFVGVSGSGKSTIVFDTLYAESKRRYIESLGVNEQFFLSKQQKANADYFGGLLPAIALSQSRTVRNPRSNVGTITQAAYYIQLLFSTCSDCKEIDKFSTSMFNLNSPLGMCLECEGTGSVHSFDETLIWPNQCESISEGGLKLGGPTKGTTKMSFFNSFVSQYGCTVDTPIKNFPNELKVALLFGQKKSKKYRVEYPGIIPSYEKLYKTTSSFETRDLIKSFMKEEVCCKCGGTGYNPESLRVLVQGKNIADVMEMSIEELRVFISDLVFEDYRKDLFDSISKNLLLILDKCIDLGVGYLSLNRAATTLSGGEMQRLHLVAQIFSQISGVVYVLDEPSSGMHSSDIEKMLCAIKQLNDVGHKNTIVMVEHTKSLIKASDYLYEIGPGAGKNGGRVVFAGSPEEMTKSATSVTGKYLAGKSIPGAVNQSMNCNCENFIVLKGVYANNLRDVDVHIPINKITCVTGVSGSGKTSLIFEALYQTMMQKKVVLMRSVEGLQDFNRVVVCDQSHIGTSTRSCPITYSDVYGDVRKMFASQPLAKKLKFTERHFSFNVSNGQCSRCKGEGKIHIKMGFLPDISVLCEECNGTRFKKEVLQVKYNGKSIADVLNLTVDEAVVFFRQNSNILGKLLPMQDVGLGYVSLGQSTSSLSGGEAQRLKLAYEISRVKKEHNLILFDEPSRGLHFEDVKKLLQIMHTLTEKGHTVVIVEHNLDIITNADYVIDLGPYGGIGGGKVCGEGTPKAISKLLTPTGVAISRYLSELKF